MSSVVISGDTSGSITLSAPAVSGSSVLTLPVATDTLAGIAATQTLTNKTLTSPIISSISNTGTLTLPTSTDTLVGRATTDTLTNKSIVATQLTGTIAAARLPAGSVLQVVSASIGSQTTSTSTTYADTGLTASITPSSASNKILVLVSQGINAVGAAAVGYGNQTNAGVQLLRGATVLIVPGSDSGGKYSMGVAATGTLALWAIVGMNYLDSPATTSSTTYKTQFAKGTSGMGAVYANDGAGGSFITLMEIAG